MRCNTIENLNGGGMAGRGNNDLMSGGVTAAFRQAYQQVLACVG